MSKREDSIFKPATLIAYTVKKLDERDPDKQIGKTIIQKMIYLLSRENIGDFNFSLYHYGPYSSEVSAELNFAEDIGMVSINWEEDKGYFIHATQELDEFISLLTDQEKETIERFVEKYGEFNAIELSIIATALYLSDYFNVPKDRLVEKVHNLKREYTREFIEGILKRAGLL
jgi:uncharacterized protein YwgA